MLGAIIGDIVGSRFEFNPTNDYNFELFSPQCSFTDDTICTIGATAANTANVSTTRKRKWYSEWYEISKM